MAREDQLAITGRILVALLVAGVSACTADGTDAGPPPSSTASPSPVDVPLDRKEEFLDTCRRWCGVQAALTEDCVKGQALLRGVPLGTTPFPENPVKSYDLACLDLCIAWRGPNAQCWQQSAESQECYAQEAIFVCDGDGGWSVFGCETAGDDPAICAEAN